MLVIGHRGAAGLAPENTLAALRAGFDAGADILEFDIRLTKDGIPILLHDASLRRTHDQRVTVSRYTIDELRKLTIDHTNNIATLEEILDEFFGKVVLNIEMKQRKSAATIIDLIESRYIVDSSDWNHVVLSSFKVDELKRARRRSENIRLWLLHDRNPFLFISYAKKLDIDGVGFHRPHLHPLALRIARRYKLFTYVFTVNRPEAAILAARQKVAGVVTDYPDRITRALAAKS